MNRAWSFPAIVALLGIAAVTAVDARVPGCPGPAIIGCCTDYSAAAFNASYGGCDRSLYSEFQCGNQADDAWLNANRNCMGPAIYHTFLSAGSPSATIVIKNNESIPVPRLLQTQQQGGFQGEVRLNGTLVATAGFPGTGTETLVYLQPGDNTLQITITPSQATDLLALYLTQYPQ